MRHAFLTVLSLGPAHGYELKQNLEQRFGDLLPSINAGQIYTTLQRLERDGLIAGEPVEGDTRGKRVYAITEAGRQELRRWLEQPTAPPRLRDEFVTKLVLAGLGGVAEPRELIERQRRECFQTLRDLEARRRSRPNGLATELLIESAALHAEADLRWLELVASRLDPPTHTRGR